MDIQNKDFHKTEVIWNRNRNTRRSKLFPEMKGINIEDSVKKVKNVSKLNKFKRSITMNEDGVDLAHKFVKKRLFQDDKSKKVSEYSSVNKLNKKQSETHSNNFTEMSQILLKRSPPILSNREKFKRQKSNQRLLQTESTKTAVCSPQHFVNDKSFIKSSCIENQMLPSNSNLLYNKSPEIISNRNRQHIGDTFLEKMNSNESKFSDLSKLNNKLYETNYNNLTEISQNSLTKAFPLLSSQGKLKTNGFKQHLFQTEIPKISKIAECSSIHSNSDTSAIKSSCTFNQIHPSTSNLLHNKSPEIMSNRKRQYVKDTFLEKMNLNGSTYANSDQLNKKFYENHSYNLTEIPSNSPILSSKELLKTNKFKQCLFKTESPKISKPVECSSLHLNNDKSVIKSSCILKQMHPSTSNLLHNKSPEIMSNRKRQHVKDTFLEKMNSNESKFADSGQLNKKLYKTPSHNLTEICQKSRTKNSKTVADSPLHSVDDTSIIKSSCIVNQMHPSTSNLLLNKSPEIMSNRKKQYKLLEKMNFSCNTPTINYSYVPQATKMLNKKSELINTHRNKVKLKLNFEDSEDIIESSEIITMACKKKCTENKNSKSKKKNLKSNIYGSVSHELKSLTNEKNEISKKNVVIDKKMIKNDHCRDNVDSLDIINTENILMPIEIKVKKKSSRKKSRKFMETFKVDNKTFEPRKANENKDSNISAPHLPSEISLIPATPEHMIIVNEPAEECSVETIVNSYIPQIEVDKSPKTPFDKNCHVLIQSIFTPPNVYSSKLPVLFESVVSPTQSFVNSELSFKIDSIESPSTVHDNFVCDTFFSPEITKKKLDKSPSPNCFDSAKKRKKVCKDGLRGKFRELINRKKSEACIREYEKNFSTKNQSKPDETTLLNVIEVWKEFRTFVLLCYYMKSETQVQKVIVTLDNCPKYATKNSIIRIYSPWLTIESKTTEIELFIGVVYAEVIEFSGSNKPLGPTGLNTNISGLHTSIFQSEIKWKCNCSEETACQCLGELSAYNYLQYMIS